MGIASVGLALGLNALLELTGVIGGSETYQTVAENQYAAALPLGLICFGLIAPIAEELLFRGIIYSCVRRYMKPIAAMVMSAAFFAMYHGNSVQGIYAFVMGCLMVYAYEYFGDFRMPVAVHIISNVLIYSISYQPGTAGMFVNWPVCLVCLAFGAGGVWLLNKEKKIYG
nr:CPBP family intramembrane glutamic endopeptidase [uncultured Acetatifactor sp.]